MRAPKPDEKVIGVTAFKARCLALIEEVANGKTARVVLLKHDKPVAAVVPVGDEPGDLWGAMKGTVKVAPGVDLTEPAGETWKANG